jgi:predicted DNA-binding WGR domain protein
MIQCGRYEYRGTTNNGNPSRKFWHVIHDKTRGVYVAKWGAIGRGVQGTKEYSRSEVTKKIREKTNKGYSYVEGYDESIGENSIHFIKNFLADEVA